MKVLLISIAAIALLATLLVIMALRRWDSRTAQMQDSLRVLAPDASPQRFHENELEGLPEPVQRFFRHCLTPGQPLIRRAIVAHEGTFRRDAGENSWVPFRSTEHFTVLPPGFIWEARIRMMPVVPVVVRDSYIRGEAGMHGSIGGLVDVVSAASTPELREGAFMRFLAEAMWIPTALLPSQGVAWSPLTDSSARATRRDGDLVIAVDFTFDAAGHIVESRAMRQGERNGRYERHSWSGRCWDVQEVEGMRIPMQAEVRWHYPEGDHPYWRGRITSMEFVWATDGPGK